MGEVSTIGLDIAKSVFQVHGVDAAGQVVIRRQLKRRYVTLVPTSSSPKEPSALSVVHRVEQPGLPADGDRHCCKRRVPGSLCKLPLSFT